MRGSEGPRFVFVRSLPVCLKGSVAPLPNAPLVFTSEGPPIELPTELPTPELPDDPPEPPPAPPPEPPPEPPLLCANANVELSANTEASHIILSFILRPRSQSEDNAKFPSRLQPTAWKRPVDEGILLDRFGQVWLDRHFPLCAGAHRQSARACFTRGSCFFAPATIIEADLRRSCSITGRKLRRPVGARFLAAWRSIAAPKMSGRFRTSHFRHWPIARSHPWSACLWRAASRILSRQPWSSR